MKVVYGDPAVSSVARQSLPLNGEEAAKLEGYQTGRHSAAGEQWGRGDYATGRRDVPSKRGASSRRGPVLRHIVQGSYAGALIGTRVDGAVTSRTEPFPSEGNSRWLG